MKRKDIKKMEKEQKKVVNKYKKQYKEYVIKDLISLMGGVQNDYKSIFKDYQGLSQDITNEKRNLTLDMDTNKINSIKKEIEEKEEKVKYYKLSLDDLASRQQAYGELIDEKVGFKIDYSNIFDVMKLIFFILENPDNLKGCR